MIQIKDNIVTKKGRSEQAVAEAISYGFEQIIQALTPWMTDYQVLQQKIVELEKKVEKYEPKVIKPATTETTPPTTSR